MGRRKKEKASILIDLTLTDSENEIINSCSESEEDTPFNPPLNVHGNILTSSHYKILQSPSSWFNDDLINGYFCKLSEAHSDKIFTFSSFFYSSLMKRGREFCLKHAIPKDFSGFLFERMGNRDGIVLFPVNSGGSHWVLVVWFIDTGTLKYYDSMMCKRSGSLIMKRISEFFNEFINLHEESKGLEDSFKNLSIHEESSIRAKKVSLIQKFEIPKGQIQQTDGSSCGPFCCLFARKLIDAEAESNRQIDDIYEFRRSLINFFLDKDK